MQVTPTTLNITINPAHRLDKGRRPKDITTAIPLEFFSLDDQAFYGVISDTFIHCQVDEDGWETQGEYESHVLHFVDWTLTGLYLLNETLCPLDKKLLKKIEKHCHASTETPKNTARIYHALYRILSMGWAFLPVEHRTRQAYRQPLVLWNHFLFEERSINLYSAEDWRQKQTALGVAQDLKAKLKTLKKFQNPVSQPKDRLFPCLHEHEVYDAICHIARAAKSAKRNPTAKAILTIWGCLLEYKQNAIDGWYDREQRQAKASALYINEEGLLGYAERNGFVRHVALPAMEKKVFSKNPLNESPKPLTRKG